MDKLFIENLLKKMKDRLTENQFQELKNTCYSLALESEKVKDIDFIKKFLDSKILKAVQKEHVNIISVY